MPVNFKNFFKPGSHDKQDNAVRTASVVEDGSAEAKKTCPDCGKETPVGELWENLNVCECGHHFRMNARQRVAYLVGNKNFAEMDAELVSENVLNFPGYDAKLSSAKLNSHENESVITGTCEIGGIKTALFVMNSEFMMGSMGSVCGEKITRLFEYATENSLPVVGYTVSGGARMQEGILSLMQMAKTSAAVRKHSDAGLLYIAVLTDPTTGGVTASFAMEGDIILAEPKATVGFAGRRVIEQTISKKLPKEFQKSEFLLEHGFADKIVSRKEQREIIANLLQMHVGGVN